jgi:hypothetical protein
MAKSNFRNICKNIHSVQASSTQASSVQASSTPASSTQASSTQASSTQAHKQSAHKQAAYVYKQAAHKQAAHKHTSCQDTSKQRPGSRTSSMYQTLLKYRHAPVQDVGHGIDQTSHKQALFTVRQSNQGLHMLPMPPCPSPCFRRR